ncbi:MAG: AbrB/MazE/SpoVT family DNA-binding domain-containing protein [Clostridia bacterium]|nr:AbrB/MazE/SpoVT family DNA-binding domain-containing protein [Clostridia bacterium]
MSKKTDGVKSTGVMRKVDQLGRVVIPKELRMALDIEDNKDLLEIYVEGDKIILKKFASGCTFCGKEGVLSSFRGKIICPDCINEIKETEMF